MEDLGSRLQALDERVTQLVQGRTEIEDRLTTVETQLLLYRQQMFQLQHTVDDGETGAAEKIYA